MAPTAQHTHHPLLSLEEPLSFRLLTLIRADPGITKSEMHEATGKRYTAEARRTALAWLKENGLAHPEQCPLPQGGPAAECWHPGPQSVEDDDEDEVTVRKPQAANRDESQCVVPYTDAHRGGSGGRWTRPQTANRQPLTVSQRSVSSTDGGLRTAEEEALPEPILVTTTDCGQRTAEASAAPKPRTKDQERAVGKVGVQGGGGCAVEADAVVMPEPNVYTDGDAVVKDVYQRGGKIVKDDNGTCTMQLPKPDPELEAAFNRLYDAICSKFYSEREFEDRMRSLLPR